MALPQTLSLAVAPADPEACNSNTPSNLDTSVATTSGAYQVVPNPSLTLTLTLRHASEGSSTQTR